MFGLKGKLAIPLIIFISVSLVSSAKGNDDAQCNVQDSVCLASFSLNVLAYKKEIQGYLNDIAVSKNIDTVHRLASIINVKTKKIYHEVDSIKNSNPAYDDDMTYLIYGAAFAGVPGMSALSATYYALGASEIKTPSQISNCKDQLDDMKFFSWWMTKCNNLDFSKKLNTIVKHKNGILFSQR